MPSKRIDAFASYHALWLAESTDSFSTSGVRDPSGTSGAFAGHQIDARVRWWVRPDTLRIEADGGVLTKGRFLEDAPNAPAGGTTLYGSVDLTASFLSKDRKIRGDSEVRRACSTGNRARSAEYRNAKQ